MIEKYINKLTKSDTANDKINIGIGGFTAEVRLRENIQFTSDVPDNYVEDGSVIHDHVINSPIVLDIEGEVSELHIKPNFISDITYKYFDKAKDIINNLFPIQKTAQTQQRINKTISKLNSALLTLDAYVKRGQNLYNLIKGNKNDSIQKKFFDFISNIYYAKELISIETPFTTYKNMRIVSFTIVRDNTTQEALRYKLTAKEVRFAETYLVENKYFKNPTESVKNKVTDKKNKGVVEGEKDDKSFLYTIKEIL